MKIALLGPITWRTPPKAYGPWEQIVSLLAEGLVAKGHDVTLFASLDSVTKAKLDGVCPQPYGENPDLDGRIYEALHVAHCLSRSHEFDIVHNNLDWLPLAMSKLCKTKMVTTIHGFSSPRILPAYKNANSAYVAISEADRSPDLEYLATVHHGIDTNAFPFTEQPEDYLLIFGRIHPDKGTLEAIEIAKKLGRNLYICGPVHDEQYWQEQVKPVIDNKQIRYLGNIGPDERHLMLGKAAALLHPINFAEPFGLSVVEAMVCGTPVVATPRGSMPEVVDQGITGYLATGIPALVDATKKALKLNRHLVREKAIKRFSAERMVDEYTKIYERLVART